MSEKRLVIWNAKDEDLARLTIEVQELLDSLPAEYAEIFLSCYNKIMDLGAAHYRKQLQALVNGQVKAFILEEVQNPLSQEQNS